MALALNATTARKTGAAALFLGSFFVVKPIWRLLDLHGPERMVFLLIPATAMVLFFRVVRASTAECGALNPAVRRYMSGLMGGMLAYMALLVLAGLAEELGWLTGLPLALLGATPLVPILGCIFVMGRYLVEEQDEYLRMRSAHAGLIATGLLLSVATIWGFLEQRGLTAHVPASYAFIVWCAGLGLGQFIQKLRA